MREGMGKWAVLIAGVVCMAVMAQAEEFVLLNVHDTEGAPYKYFEKDASAHGDIPTNWKTPVDYYNGTWYQRFVVHSMGNMQYPFQQFSFILTLRDAQGDDAHPLESTCMYQFADVGKDKIKETIVKTKDIWAKSSFSFTDSPAKRFRTQPRIYYSGGRSDVSCSKLSSVLGKISGASSCDDVQKWFFPLNYDYQAVIVSAGTTFSGWENYPLKSGLQTAINTHQPTAKDFRVVNSRINAGPALLFDMRGALIGKADNANAKGLLCIQPYADNAKVLKMK
jgi:hypothetical protein